MENFVPFEKLSKKEKKRLNAVKRSNWGTVNPSMRVESSSKEYTRKRKHKGKLDYDE